MRFERTEFSGNQMKKSSFRYRDKHFMLLGLIFWSKQFSIDLFWQGDKIIN